MTQRLAAGRLLRSVCLLLASAGVACSSNPDPSALSIPPSQYWDGNGGKWSSFLIQVGTPGQPVRLLPGTSATPGSTTWTIIPQGCSQANPNLASCKDDRGGLFRSNQSTTWSTEGLSGGPSGALFQLTTFVEGGLGYTGNAFYGYDTINLGLPGSNLPTIDHQLIAGIATNDFWIGSLGLSPLPFNFSNYNDAQPSLLATLRNQSLIPSMSWAYTAGAVYKDPPAFGSLTLGGFDSTRRPPISSGATFAFGPDISRDLLVSLDAITYDTAGSSPLLASSIDIFIDSLITDLWLPINVCRAFEQEFGLTWNSSLQSYLVNDKAHEALLAQNPAFTFRFTTSGAEEVVEIVLPFAAFDLEMDPPLIESSARYFPLKRAQNETQYVLGRAFLQEAYVIADYDRRQFSISQAMFPSTDVGSKIFSIHPPGEKGDEAPQSKDRDRGLDAGAIAGIVIGCVVLLSATVLLAVWLRRKRRGSVAADSQHFFHAAEKRSEADAVFEGDDQIGIGELSADRSWIPELHGQERRKHRSELENPEPVVAELEAK